MPMAAPTVLRHSAVQPGAVFSQVSVQVGSDTSRMAFCTSVMSAGRHWNTHQLELLQVHGSLPVLQLAASTARSSEYFQISFSSVVNAACSWVCCAGVSFFQADRPMA